MWILLKVKTRKYYGNEEMIKLEKKQGEMKKKKMDDLIFLNQIIFYQIQGRWKHWFGWKMKKNSRDNQNRREENRYHLHQLI